MREIHGYLCVASRETNIWQYFFGLNNENFEWNELRPYTSIAAAKRMKNTLAKELEEIIRLRIARVDMYMAETYEENPSFRDETQLVVISKCPPSIWEIDGSMLLLGAIHGDSLRFGYECGSQLLRNGFLPFREILEKEWAMSKEWRVLTAYTQASRVADEVLRQSKRIPLMATFSISWRGEEWHRA